MTAAGLCFPLQWLEQRATGLGLAVAWGVLCGCLDSPPTYAPRGQRPPFVVAGQVVPPMGAIYEGPLPVQINVPFRSEDVNIPLVARLHQDLVPGANAEGVQTIQKDVPAGIYEDTGRSVTMDWRLPLEGCHSLTLILTYHDNLVAAGPLDDTLAARVVWWLNMDDVDGDVTMSSCPGSAQSAVAQ